MLINPERQILMGALFFSRDCKSDKINADEQRKVKVEYFVLVRNPEFDPKGLATGGIGTRHITKVQSELIGKTPVLQVKLNPEGTKSLADLTSKNCPTRPMSTDGIRRYLAVAVDGKVLMAPSIQTVISEGFFAIAGGFTQKDLDVLADKLKPKR